MKWNEKWGISKRPKISGTIYGCSQTVFSWQLNVLNKMSKKDNNCEILILEEKIKDMRNSLGPPDYKMLLLQIFLMNANI